MSRIMQLNLFADGSSAATTAQRSVVTKPAQPDISATNPHTVLFIYSVCYIKHTYVTAGSDIATVKGPYGYSGRVVFECGN